MAREHCRVGSGASSDKEIDTVCYTSQLQVHSTARIDHLSVVVLVLVVVYCSCCTVVNEESLEEIQFANHRNGAQDKQANSWCRGEWNRVPWSSSCQEGRQWATATIDCVTVELEVMEN